MLTFPPQSRRWERHFLIHRKIINHTYNRTHTGSGRVVPDPEIVSLVPRRKIADSFVWVRDYEIVDYGHGAGAGYTIRYG